METLPVLLVEDEALISAMIEDALKEGGFTVSSVATGAAAIQLLEAPDAAFRALVTDINLSDEITGWDVAKRARELTAELAVVYMTGGGLGEWSANGVPNSVLVAKPFAAAQVVTAVSLLLNAVTAPST